jgi:hypothetical protein
MSNEPCNIAASCAPCARADASPPASPSHSAGAGASPPVSPSQGAGADASRPGQNNPALHGEELNLYMLALLDKFSVEFKGEDLLELVDRAIEHARASFVIPRHGAGADASRADVLGENNHPALSEEALGYPLLALFDKIVRDLKGDSLSALIDSVLEDARASSDVEMVKDLFVLAFQTRWCRGGKAEKLLFYKFIVHLYERFPNVVLDLLHLIPKYGYWKDLLSLLLECPTRGYDEMHAKVWSLFADQLGSDLLELETALEESRTPRISLCAKYAPSEGGQHSKVLRADKEICKVMFHGDISGHHVRAKYRRMLSRLRTQLHLTETLMCAQRWNEIDCAKVPSLCMHRQKKAFLNENRGLKPERPAHLEREAYREKFLEQLKNGVMLKGKQLFPHELVAQVCLVCVTCSTVRCCS